MSVDAFYEKHVKLCQQKKDPISKPRLKKMVAIYNYYFQYYKTSCVDYIESLIIGAISAGEESHVIYDENTLDTGLTADDLIEIFKVGIDGHPSIESFFNDKLGTTDFSITLHRAAHCRVQIVGDTTVIVQFVLHWKKPSVTVAKENLLNRCSKLFDEHGF